MSYSFRPAKREAVNLLVGLAGASGSGKTFSALRLATGLAGGKKFVVLDTEARRALHYADRFDFDYAEIESPFRPATYQDAIESAAEAGYPVIVVDSFSHEHAGEGGILDMAEDELQRMAGEDWKKRETCKMASWIKPKQEHKRMMDRLLHVSAHLVICLRAEQKIEMRKVEGRMQVVPKRTAAGFSDWIPICEKNLPYELTASMILSPEAPGVPIPVKIQEQHKGCFPDGKVIDEETGKRLAEWAAGCVATRPAETKTATGTPFSSVIDLALAQDPVITETDLCEYLRLRESALLEDQPIDTLRKLYRDIGTGEVARWIEARNRQ